jgi:hypothetical protein
MAAKQCKRSKVYRLKIEALHLQLATPQSIRSSKKMNSKNESIPCLLSCLHPCTLAPQLPCSALLRSSKKTQKIFFYSKSYVNPTSRTFVSSVIHSHLRPSNLQLIA